MKNNILITGSNGQLGSEIKFLSQEFKDYTYFYTDVAELDICDLEAIRTFVIDNNINAIINCAAYTAVDKAETEHELADLINHQAVANLASVAKECNCKLIHISTDYVFDGTKTSPYTEEDTPNPQSVYGKTKLAGEQALQRINPGNSIIIRTSWVYSSFGNNFVKTMLRLGKERDELNVVADQVGSPTNARDLAHTILEILPQLNNKKVAIYHYTNEGICSWAAFATEIFKITNINCCVNSITTAEYPTPAQRPAYSVMSKKKMKEAFEIAIPNWKDGLQRMMEVNNKN